MQGARILLLEDEASFAHGLKRFLGQVEPAWCVEWLDDPDAAMETALADQFDVALIDWNLGKARSGLEFCRDFRRTRPECALVILSVREEIEDRVQAIQAGADDFVTKGLEPAELRARIHVAMARNARRKGQDFTQLSCGPLVASLLRQELLLNGQSVELTKHQWLLMVRLLHRPGEPVPAHELCQFAGIQSDASHQNLRNEMRRLRQRLGEAGALICALRGHGYQLSCVEAHRIRNDT